MNIQTKAIIKSGLISGIIYAGLMAGFDYFDGGIFKIWKFLFLAVFFGLSIVVLVKYNLKKQAKKEDKKQK